jgi:methyl-accepting chemotaxis protein
MNASLPFFRKLPIKRKLTVIVLGTTIVALLAACAAFVTYELITFRGALTEKLQVLGDVLGTNSTAAIQFKNDSDAEEVLGALKADPEVVAACIYSAEGQLFASYVRPGTPKSFPPKPGKDGARFDSGHAVILRPIVLDDKRVGTIYLDASLERLYSHIVSYAKISAWVLVGSFLLAMALSAASQRFISTPVLTLAETARRVSDRKDYSLRAEKQTEDEMGLLTDSFNQMLTDIERSTSALQKANESLQSQARQITDGVTVLGSSAGDILKAATALASTATQTATSVTETTATVEEVRQTAEASSQKARHVAESAKKSAQIAQTGKKATEDAIEGINRIKQQMASIAESMVRLSEQTQAIGGIIATVDDLAQQSNILAVNASIEAAKAGEHGKGFSVVAQEVKSLAEQSRQATTRVRGILNDIQKATSAAVLATEQGSKAVESGVRQSEQAGGSIETLSKSVVEAAQSATQIAASSQQQLVGVDQVAGAMNSIKDASVQNVDSAKQLEAAARSLTELGQRLKRLLEGHGAPQSG